MAKRAILVRFIGDPEDHESQLEVSRVLYAVRWHVAQRHLKAAWTETIEVDAAIRRHVLVVTADGRVAITRYTTIAGFRADIGDPDLVRGNQSVCINVRRIDRVVRSEGS